MKGKGENNPCVESSPPPALTTPLTGRTPLGQSSLTGILKKGKRVFKTVKGALLKLTSYDLYPMDIPDDNCFKKFWFYYRLRGIDRVKASIESPSPSFPMLLNGCPFPGVVSFE